MRQRYKWPKLVGMTPPAGIVATELHWSRCINHQSGSGEARLPSKIFKMRRELQQLNTALLAEVDAVLKDQGSSLRLWTFTSQKGPLW